MPRELRLSIASSPYTTCLWEPNVSLGGSYLTGSFFMYILTVNGYEDNWVQRQCPPLERGGVEEKNLYYEFSIYLKVNMIVLPSFSKVTGGNLSKYRTQLLS